MRDEVKTQQVTKLRSDKMYKTSMWFRINPTSIWLRIKVNRNKLSVWLTRTIIYGNSTIVEEVPKTAAQIKDTLQ